MTDQWCVLLKASHGYVVYGPMEAVEAQAFSLFLGDTVDPAIVLKMASPIGEAMAWYRQEQDRNNCTHAAGCEVHPMFCPPAPGTQVCTGEGDCPVHARTNLR